jgi:hypothetical protein
MWTSIGTIAHEQRELMSVASMRSRTDAYRACSAPRSEMHKVVIMRITDGTLAPMGPGAGSSVIVLMGAGLILSGP